MHVTMSCIIYNLSQRNAATWRRSLFFCCMIFQRSSSYRHTPRRIYPRRCCTLGRRFFYSVIRPALSSRSLALISCSGAIGLGFYGNEEANKGILRLKDATVDTVDTVARIKYQVRGTSWILFFAGYSVVSMKYHSIEKNLHGHIRNT